MYSFLLTAIKCTANTNKYAANTILTVNYDNAKILWLKSIAL